MAKKKPISAAEASKVEKAPKPKAEPKPEAPDPTQPREGLKFHLDRDPNDPRLS